MRGGYYIGFLSVFWLLLTGGCSSNILKENEQSLSAVDRIYSLDPQRQFIGQVVDDFHFLDSIEERQIHFDEVNQDKVVIIQSFSRGCPACVQGIYDYNYLYGKYGDKIEIIYMDLDPNDKPEDVVSVKEDYEGRDWLWAHYQGSLLPFYDQFNFKANDMTLIIDEGGTVVYADSFSVPVTRLEKEIEKLL